MNEMDLIMEVEKHAVLYAKATPEESDATLVDDAWKEIEEAMNIPEADCKKRWSCLHETFIKLRRKHGRRIKWPYDQAMQFLLPHVKLQPDTVSLQRDTDDSEYESSSDSERSFGLVYEEEDEIRPWLMKQVHEGENIESDDSSEDEYDANERFIATCAKILHGLEPEQRPRVMAHIAKRLNEFARRCRTLNLPYATPPSEYESDDGRMPVDWD